MNVSGIAEGPIGGHSQNGRYNISARFNKKTLCHRIERIYQLGDRITLTNLEASHFLQPDCGRKYCDTGNSLIFLDPPYYEQGRNLYSSFATDRIHSLIAERLTSESKWKWILTETAPQINNLYPPDKVMKYEYEIAYSATKRGRYAEYLFTRHPLE